jgi:hypothetical protein
MTKPKLPVNGGPGTTKVCRLPLAQLGRPMTYLRRQVLAFRRQVEHEVLAVHGEIGIATAARIATACAAIRQAARVERILARCKGPGETGGLSHELWLAYSDRSLKYRETADRALAALELSRLSSGRVTDAFDALYRQITPQIVQEPAAETKSPVGRHDDPEAADGQQDPIERGKADP